MTKRKLPKADGPVTRVNHTVDDYTTRRLVVLGEGNASLGVRVASRAAYDLYQRDRLYLGAPIVPAIEALVESLDGTPAGVKLAEMRTVLGEMLAAGVLPGPWTERVRRTLGV